MASKTYDFKAYSGRCILYVLDACDTIKEGADLLSDHYQKQERVRRIFQQYVKCETKDVKFPRRSKPEAVVEYFKTEKKTWKKNDLIIVYFHGNAAGNGEDYLWRFEKFPSREVEAYEVMDVIIQAKGDNLFLLDAYIPDRFHDLWVPPRGKNGKCLKNVEILAKGETLETSDGRKVTSDPGNFTVQIGRTLEKLVKEIKGFKCNECEDDVPEEQLNGPFMCRLCGSETKRKSAFAGYKAPLSLPELIIKHDSFIREEGPIMNAKIRRIDPHKGSHVRRLVIHPDRVRETGLVEFFKKVEVDPLPADHVAGKDVDEEDEDEGFEDDENVPLDTNTVNAESAEMHQLFVEDNTTTANTESADTDGLFVEQDKEQQGSKEQAASGAVDGQFE